MLAMYIMTMTGTTYVVRSHRLQPSRSWANLVSPEQYQGQEIGTINLPLSYPKEEYLDCETIGFWEDMDKYHANDKEMHERGRRGAQRNARDHARAPVQWDDSKHGGFTTAERPWMLANPYYSEINVASQVDDPDSVLSFYKQIIKFRKDYKDLLVYGTFRLLDKDNERTFEYIKGNNDSSAQAVVILNFTREQVPFAIPEGLHGEAKLAVSNYKDSRADTLEAYEGRIYLVNA